MANRILRDWTCSENIDALSPQAEVFFTRLIMKADDFGCFHGNPKLIKAALFPLREPADKEILKWVSECCKVGILQHYEVDGKQYIIIKDFGQRLRTMNRKFPEPPTIVSNMLTSDSNAPLETKRNEDETETEDETKDLPPSVFDFRKSLLGIGVSKDVLSTWMEIRRKAKAVNSEIAFKGIEREIIKTGRSPDECIRIAVEKSWRGFEADWLTKISTNGTTTQQHTNLKGPTMGQRLEEAKRRAKERRMQQGDSGTSDASDEFASYTDAD